MNLIFDIDGTICFDGRKIEESILSALRKAVELGHRIIFASARPFRDIVPLLPADFRQKYIIGLNGAMVFYKEELKEYRMIEKKIYQNVASFCLEHNLPFFIDDILDYGVHRKEKVSFFPFVDVKKVAKELKLNEVERPLKAVIFTGEEELIEKLMKLADEERSDVMYHEGEGILYINPKNTNKATTAARHFESFVCFGNDKNDIELFRKARYSVMVGDYEPLRKYSDEAVEADPDSVSEKILQLLKKISECNGKFYEGKIFTDVGTSLRMKK